MKIFTDDAVYVERKDLTYLISTDLPLTTVLYLKSLDKNLITLTENNKHDFIKIKGLHEKLFFLDMDWILDYNNILATSENEILKQSLEASLESKQLINEYNVLNEIEKLNNKDIFTRANLLKYKSDALKESILYKNGILPINILEEDEKVIKILKENMCFE